MGERALRSLRVAAVAAALCGCAAVRNARTAQDPKSAVPGERTPTAAELNVPTTGPLRLADAVAVALRVQPTVLKAKRAAEAAAARVGEAEGAFLPQVSADAGMSYQDQAGTVVSQTKQMHRFESLGFQVSWLLFDFGRTSALARQSAAEWLAAQADERDAEIAAVFGVRSAYYGLVKEIQLRDVAAESVRQFQEHLDQVREFVKVGTRIPYDESKAEVDLGNAKLTLVQTEDAVLLAQAALANAMGLAEKTDWTPSEEAPQTAPPATFDASWDAARAGRPSLAAAEAREEAAYHLVDAQIGALYPSLALDLGYSQGGARLPFPWSFKAGPSVSWTPFDGFKNLYSVDEAVAALKSSRADRALAEQTAWLDVRTAWLGIEDAMRRLDLTALVVASARENVRLAQGRFDARVGTSVELTDAQQALTQARADEVQARTDRELATARLLRAIGRTEEPPAREKQR